LKDTFDLVKTLQIDWNLPVNGAAVDQRRKHSTPRSESPTNRRHAQHYVQSLAYSELKWIINIGNVKVN